MTSRILSRAFSSTSRRLATESTASHSDGAIDLRFPKSKSASPFEIFHFSPNEPLTPSKIKARYYELCKLYHPDLSKGKQKQGDDLEGDGEFKQIVEAYELLRNPTKRSIYLRSGYGWSTPSGARSNAGGDAWNDGYSFKRGRPMSASAPRGAYPSAAWDWHSSAGWTDPHNPHWRPEYTANGSTSSGLDPSSTGWKGQGPLGRNGTIFLALASLTLFATPLTVWSATPTSSGTSSLTNSESGWIPMVRDKRHRDAAEALETARREAKVSNFAKREAIKRRVREIERQRALERVRQVESIEKGERGTGHLEMRKEQLTLPPPDDNTPPARVFPSPKPR